MRWLGCSAYDAGMKQVRQYSEFTSYFGQDKVNSLKVKGSFC